VGVEGGMGTGAGTGMGGGGGADGGGAILLLVLGGKPSKSGPSLLLLVDLLNSLIFYSN